MQKDRWVLMESLFQRALSMAEGQRAQFLAKACGGDRALEHEIIQLLADDAAAATFLAACPVSPEMLLQRNLTPNAPGIEPGKRLGPYRLTHEIGRGGMGTVYAAERVDGQFEQGVAIKLLNPELVSAASTGNGKYSPASSIHISHGFSMVG